MPDYDRDPEYDPDEQSLALAVVRQSKGSDDSASLEEQREVVPEMIQDETNMDAIERLDMGVHTGFSLHEREPDEPHVEGCDAYMDALDAVKRGRYDVVAAYEERRLARDQFIERWDYAVRRGDAEFLFKVSTPDDELTAGVTRVVERAKKKQEIEAARRAVRRRQEQGYYQGGEWFGLEFDANGKYLTQGEDFDQAMAMLEMRDRGRSYREIRDEIGVALGTQKRILDRREVYDAVADGHVVGADGIVLRQTNDEITTDD